MKSERSHGNEAQPHTSGGLLSPLRNMPICTWTFKLTFKVKICLTVPSFSIEERGWNSLRVISVLLSFQNYFFPAFSSGVPNNEKIEGQKTANKDRGVKWIFRWVWIIEFQVRNSKRSGSDKLSQVTWGLWVSAKELMLSNCDAREDSWESLGQQGDQTSQF